MVKKFALESILKMIWGREGGGGSSFFLSYSLTLSFSLFLSLSFSLFVSLLFILLVHLFIHVPLASRFITHMLKARVGVRLLVEQQLALHHPSSGYNGVIAYRVSPITVCFFFYLSIYLYVWVGGGSVYKYLCLSFYLYNHGHIYSKLYSDPSLICNVFFLPDLCSLC